MRVLECTWTPNSCSGCFSHNIISNRCGLDNAFRILCGSIWPPWGKYQNVECLTLTVVLHYAVVLYTRLAPYREYYLHLSYANFYVKARKIYKFLWGWRWGLPKVSTGQEFINFYGVAMWTAKIFHRPGLTSPFGLRRAKVSFWQSPLPLQELYVLEEKGKRWMQAVKVEFRRILIVLYL